MSHINKLDKKTQDRHFSHELYGSKGSHRRKFNPERQEKYENNKFWDTCKFNRSKADA